ncbi:glycosyltransferase [Helicobacter anatolicus]|uniref:glycosyltransferase n=1 Tax=Helicobacter anatolicus TaxID=2905874 RepID=UPI001E48FFB4|nr:glycosyltransferase [Helicobacter anatolicus]MCE3039746.1 glycosyltransferase [Helicobacter anatolicus]
MLQNIILLNDFDITQRPRPFRMLEMLKNHYNLFAIARECKEITGIKTFAYPPLKSSKDRSKKEQNELIKKLKNKDFIPLIYTKNRMKILDFFKEIPTANLIIVEDITLLPFAIDYKKNCPKTKILIDLREFYPLEYENNPQWLESFGEFFSFICKNYLPYVDFAITISEGIAKKYQQDFYLDCKIFYSLPPYHNLSPTQINNKIQIIYHGFLSPDRNSDFLLEIASQLKEDFHINILGLSNQKDYLQSLKDKAPKNVSFIPPVPMQELINFTNVFDIGILTLSPNTFNNANAMPNKFFEYIQARLALISTPLPSLAPLIKKYNIGMCAKDFQAKSLAETLNTLTKKQIMCYKNSAHNAAQTLNTTQNQKLILKWIKELIQSS